MSYTPPAKPLDVPQTHAYHRPPAGNATRSPCPGLNTLANHGYMYVPLTSLNYAEAYT